MKQELYLIGVSHLVDSRSAVDNYPKIKSILTEIHPSFVTLEHRLRRADLSYLGIRLFYDPVEKLDNREQEAVKIPQNGDEYVSAIIYCRRTKTPFYCIDRAEKSETEAANLNLLEIPDVLSVSTNSPEYFDMHARNIYMANAMQQVAAQYAEGIGVHIGGDAHISSRNYPLQKLLKSFNVHLIHLDSYQMNQAEQA